MSVILNTPTVVRFTASSCPECHLRVAAALGADVSHASAEDAGDILASRVIHYMKLMKMPNGLRDLEYTEDDIPALVAGTMPQHRVTKLSPRPADEADLTSLFQQSMSIW